MTNYDDNLENSDNDPEVSSQYRAFASETTPKALDGIVLHVARAALRTSPSGWSGAWYRPAGIVATLGLSLALILQFNDLQIFTATTDPAARADAPQEASVFQDAADAAAISVQESGAIADESLQLSNGGANYPPAITNSEIATNGRTPLRRCNDEQIALPDQWWQCIQDLRKSGHTDDADVELAYLYETFPEYMPAR